MAANKRQRIGLVGNSIEPIDEDDIDYELESPNTFFGSHINLIPLQNSVAGPRLFYGARFYNQALPLKNNEAPLVQNAIDNDPEGRSFDEYWGTSAGALRSKIGGIVKTVDSDSISILDDTGKEHKIPIYNNFSFNRKTGFHQTPLVKPGDQVTPNQLLARSNYTDDKGTLALGVNARVGLVPYEGRSLDDAVVISEDFAKKLTSSHMLGFNQDFKRGIKGGKNHYISIFPQNFTKNQLKKLDDEGVVKPGSILNKGDPIILATAPRIISSQSAQLGKLSKYLRHARNDAAQVWEYDFPGEVTDVEHMEGSVKLNIKTELPAQVGDKIVMRSGQKGVISKILPRDHTPRTKDGKPLDVLLNPLSIPSRVNNSLIYELLLGKVARAKGKPFKLKGFNNANEKWYEYVKNQLAEAGLSDVEEVYDPRLDLTLENPVTIGDAYILKLHHTSESKGSARAQGAYDLSQQPLKGGDEEAKSKRLSGLESHGLLSAGAYNTLKEVSTLRGQKNDEYWRAIRQGQFPRNPGKPFIWDKFLAIMAGTGIRTKDKGKGRIRIGPFTDKDLDEKKPLEVKSGEIVDIKSLNPISGGLFDPALTGTNSWGYIPLDFPVPNPAFEEPIRKLLGLTKEKFNKVMIGDEVLENGETGPTGILNALRDIDVEEIEKESRDIIRSGKKTKRPDAIKKLNYIEGMRRNEITPADLMITKVPVIPAKFRPFAVVGDTFIAGDANELYRDLINIRDAHRKLVKAVGEEGAKDNISNVYRAVKASYGFDDPVTPKLKQVGVSGFLQQLVGTNPKLSIPQRKLFSKPVDFTGRGVITVDPDLGINEVGIPEEMAWKLFGTYLQRRLVRQGMSPAAAAVAIRDRNDMAKKALDIELKERPIMYSRAPAWHKFNTIGGYAKLVEGDAIAINPLVGTGLNADHDGDTMNIHVPALPETVEEVKEKLLPSRMLHSIRNPEQVIPVPKHELILGLYSAINRPARDTHVFPDEETALDAIRSGRVRLSDEIIIKNNE